MQSAKTLSCLRWNSDIYDLKIQSRITRSWFMTEHFPVNIRHPCVVMPWDAKLTRFFKKAEVYVCQSMCTKDLRSLWPLYTRDSNSSIYQFKKKTNWMNSGVIPGPTCTHKINLKIRSSGNIYSVLRHFFSLQTDNAPAEKTARSCGAHCGKEVITHRAETVVHVPSSRRRGQRDKHAKLSMIGGVPSLRSIKALSFVLSILHQSRISLKCLLNMPRF